MSYAPDKQTDLNILPTSTLSVGVGGMFKSVCLSDIVGRDGFEDRMFEVKAKQSYSFTSEKY